MCRVSLEHINDDGADDATRHILVCWPSLTFTHLSYPSGNRACSVFRAWIGFGILSFVSDCLDATIVLHVSTLGCVFRCTYLLLAGEIVGLRRQLKILAQLSSCDRVVERFGVEVRLYCQIFIAGEEFLRSAIIRQAQA